MKNPARRGLKPAKSSHGAGQLHDVPDLQPPLRILHDLRRLDWDSKQLPPSDIDYTADEITNSGNGSTLVLIFRFFF